MTTYPILTLEDGEVADPAWFADITDSANDHEDRLGALEGVAWVSYTPAWTTSGTAPTLGNATLTGRYRQPPGTGLVIAEVQFIFGSTSAAGTGEFRFSLPLDADATATSYSVGPAWLLDSGVTERSGTVRVLTSTTASLISPTGPVAQTVPWTWNTSDQIRFQITYDAA
jgi:hypothetical protein